MFKLLFIYSCLVYSTCLAAESSSIPSGYNLTASYAWKLVVANVDWNTARRNCVKDGAHLAVIRSKDEQLMYADAMRKKNVSQAWIGLHDQFEEGEFVTVLDEELKNIGYANWTTIYNKVEPDNDNNQDCVNIVKEDGGMDDNWCVANFSYICKINFTRDASSEKCEHLGLFLNQLIGDVKFLPLNLGSILSTLIELKKIGIESLVGTVGQIGGQLLNLNLGSIISILQGGKNISLPIVGGNSTLTGDGQLLSLILSILGGSNNNGGLPIVGGNSTQSGHGQLLSLILSILGGSNNSGLPIVGGNSSQVGNNGQLLNLILSILGGSNNSGLPIVGGNVGQIGGGLSLCNLTSSIVSILGGGNNIGLPILGGNSGQTGGLPLIPSGLDVLSPILQGSKDLGGAASSLKQSIGKVETQVSGALPNLPKPLQSLFNVKLGV